MVIIVIGLGSYILLFSILSQPEKEIVYLSTMAALLGAIVSLWVYLEMKETRVKA